MVLNTWLAPGDEAAAASVRSYITEEVALADPSHIVPHDGDHFKRVEEWMMRLVPQSRWSKLTDLERKALTWCAWTHDVGMSSKSYETPPQAAAIRERHVEKSASWTADHYKQLKISVADAQTLSTIIPFHSRKYNIDKCPHRLQFGHESIRAQLIAAYLRLADALEVSNERALDGQEHRVSLLFGELSRASDPTLFHWVKSIVVGSIGCNHRTRGIEVQFVRPAAYEFDPKKAALFEYVERFVENEIADELATVEKTLARGGVSSYHSITAERINLIDSLASAQIDNSLNRVSTYIQMTRSPSASAVTHAALDAISSIADASKSSKNPYGSHEGLRDTLDILLHSLADQVAERPCHVELQRVHSWLEKKTTTVWPKALEQSVAKELGEFKTSFDNLITPGDARIEANAKSLYAVLNNGQLDDRLKPWTFLLFGYSETVAKVIAKFEEDTRVPVALYVAEGRPKSQHGAYNRPTYVDGEEYATAITRARQALTQNPKGGPNPAKIHLIPDASTATILSHRADQNPGRPLVDAVLFGANGIFNKPEPVVAHTAGHLGIAIAANHLSVPVIVFGSKAKVDEVAPDGWWELDRANTWLTSDRESLDRLSNRGIETKRNPKEDHVPLSLVEALICDGEVLKCKANPASVELQLEAWLKFANGVCA